MDTPDSFNSELQALTPIVANFSVDSTTLLLVFGGIAGGVGIPPFEFFNLTSGFQAKKIFIRDLEQAWYHHGLPTFASDIDGITHSLQQEIIKQSIYRLVVCGNSMGGYAALLFGWLLGADEVHAFSPQTFIDQWNRLIHLDLRWATQIRKAQLTKTARKEYFDLKQVFMTEKPKSTWFHIYFSLSNRLDKTHALRMRTTPRVILHPSEAGGHTLVKHLRDTGLLKDILLKALDP